MKTESQAVGTRYQNNDRNVFNNNRRLECGGMWNGRAIIQTTDGGGLGWVWVWLVG